MSRASLRRLLESPVFNTIIRVSVVVSLVAWGLSARQDREQTRQTKALAACVAAYNDANNARSKILTEAAEAERIAERRADDAQAALFLSPTVGKPASQRTAIEQAHILKLLRLYQVALSNQKEERRAADDARRVHPIPEPPKAVCD